MLAGRQFHQRADDRCRRRLELDEVSVGVRVDIGVDRAVNLFAVLDQAMLWFCSLLVEHVLLNGRRKTYLTASNDIKNKPPTACIGPDMSRPNVRPRDPASDRLLTIGARSLPNRHRRTIGPPML